MKRYPQIVAGEKIMPVMRGYRMACCDCGLVHQLEFEIIEQDGEQRVVFSATRNNRATAQIRRRKM